MPLPGLKPAGAFCALPSSIRSETMVGRKYSHLRGLAGRFSARKAPKRACASFIKLAVRPQQPMLTRVSPGRSTQASPSA